MNTARTVFPVILLWLAALPLAAATPEMTLGNAGELYRLEAGAYGDLFRGGEDHAAATPVLALDVAAERLLVPGTGEARVESEPRLFYDPRSAAALVLWQSAPAGASAFRLDFAVYRDGTWSEVRPLQAEGEAIAFAAPPRVVFTRDAFDLELGDGETWSASRSVLHLLYHDGEGVARYLPLMFVDGAYLGWHESLTLSSELFTLGEGEERPANPATEGLRQALNLEPVADGRAVLATFVNPDSRHLGAVELRVRPLKLEALGDHLRDRILAAAELYDPGDLDAFADEIRAEISFSGYRVGLHPGIVEFVADEVGDWLGESGAEYGLDGLVSLSDDASELAIELTSSVTASVVEDPANPGEEILELELGGLLDELESSSPLARILELEVRSERPVPVIGDGVAAIFPSPNGRDLLVGWKADGSHKIRYVESRSDRDGGQWSAQRTLTLGGEIDLDRAIELLQRKIR